MSEDLEDSLNALSRRLTVLIHLSAYQIVQGMTVAEAAPVLRRLGLTPGEIATIFDTTVQSVSVRIAEARRKPRKKKRATRK